MSAPASDVVLVRPRKVRRVAIPAAIVLVVVFTVVGILLGNSPTGVIFRLSDQIAMVGIGVLLACGVLLFVRPRVRADLKGVEVRNVIGTQRYGWDLIQTISFPDSAPWARLELPEDEYVPIMAIQAVDGEHAVKAMRDLRVLRRRVDQQD